MLGASNIAGSPGYVRRTGMHMLWWLLSFYALAIVDGWFMPYLMGVPVAAWGYDIAKFVLLPAALLLVFHFRYRVSPRSLMVIGRGPGYRGWEWPAVALFAGGLLFLIYVYIAPLALSAGLAILSYVNGEPSWDDVRRFAYGSMVPKSGVWRWIVIFFFATSAGIVEEILYRGALREAIAALLGPRATGVYIAASALAFALAHWEQGLDGVWGALVFGVAAAWLYLKLGDLRPLMLGHALVDVYEFW